MDCRRCYSRTNKDVLLQIKVCGNGTWVEPVSLVHKGPAKADLTVERCSADALQGDFPVMYTLQPFGISEASTEPSRASNVSGGKQISRSHMLLRPLNNWPDEGGGGGGGVGSGGCDADEAPTAIAVTMWDLPIGLMGLQPFVKPHLSSWAPIACLHAGLE